MSRSLALAVFMLGTLLWPPWAHSDQPCEVVPMPCTFEALPFKFTVVVAETRQPLADVHALAEWQTYGPGGRLNGPLMVLDAVSASDGLLSFSGWGPIQGPVDGLGVGRDPVITLFKTGYKALVINNGYLPPAREKERIRRFAQNGWTYALEPFRDTPDEWIRELKRIYRGVAFPRGDNQSLQFRRPYLNRLLRVWAERNKAPERHLNRPGFFWFVEEHMKDLEDRQ